MKSSKKNKNENSKNIKIVLRLLKILENKIPRKDLKYYEYLKIAKWFLVIIKIKDTK